MNVCPAAKARPMVRIRKETARLRVKARARQRARQRARGDAAR